MKRSLSFVARAPKGAVLAAAVLGFAGVSALHAGGAGAHTVTTIYPLTCGTTGLGATFVTPHVPETGTLPGATFAFTIAPQFTATKTLPVKSVSFDIPKPDLVASFGAVTFSGGNLAGTSSIASNDTVSLTFTGTTTTDQIQMPTITLTAVARASAVVGAKIVWSGPSMIMTDSDMCTPANGVLTIGTTPILDPAVSTTVAAAHDHGVAAGVTTTTMAGDHGNVTTTSMAADHDHGVDAGVTTTTMAGDHGNVTTTTVAGDHDHGNGTTTTRRVPTARPHASTTRVTTTAPVVANPVAAFFRWLFSVLFGIK